MNILKTEFAGLKLVNPIIIASSGKTNSAQNNYEFEQAGAGAIVLKSLFEENITIQEDKFASQDIHSEEADYMHAYLTTNAIEEYIALIKETKSLCTIPIIASINCSGLGKWIEFAKIIEQAGADALELNIMAIPCSVNYKWGEYEKQHVLIVNEVKKQIKIPIIVKLGANLTNPVALIDMLYGAGASGIVLFNRMYQTEIDINKFEFTSGQVLSTESELSNPLRWTAISSGIVDKIDYAVSGGIKKGEDIVKAILAGASAIEVCSAIYKEGSQWITRAVNFIFQWQEENNRSEERRVGTEWVRTCRVGVWSGRHEIKARRRWR